MDKITNWVCLIAWIIVLVIGIIMCCMSRPINPISFMCAASVCCVHYAEKILDI